MSFLVVKNLLNKEDYPRKLASKIEKYYRKLLKKGLLDRLDVRTAVKFIALWSVDELYREIHGSMRIDERILETMLYGTEVRGDERKRDGKERSA